MHRNAECPGPLARYSSKCLDSGLCHERGGGSRVDIHGAARAPSRFSGLRICTSAAGSSFQRPMATEIKLVSGNGRRARLVAHKLVTPRFRPTELGSEQFRISKRERSLAADRTARDAVRIRLRSATSL